MLYVVKKIQNKTPGDKPGFYFVAKKKIFKTAVLRNRAKRIARHAFKKALKNIDNTWLPKCSLIFFLERDIIQESFNNIVQSFKEDLLQSK